MYVEYNIKMSYIINCNCEILFNYAPRYGVPLFCGTKTDPATAAVSAEAIFATEDEANRTAIELAKNGHTVVHVRSQVKA